MTARRYPLRARPVRVTPPALAEQLGRWARGIEALAGGVGSTAAHPRAGPAVEIFEFSSEDDDWLICARPRTGGVIGIAKPPTLRGATATRTVNGEAQEILPAYGAGPIFAVWVPAGALGIAVPGGGTTLLHWLDLNVDARAWAQDVS